MEAPECPLCHKKEWRHACDQSPAVALSNSRVVKVAEGTAKIAVEAPKGKFDRVAYQRAYMRAYRARKK